jgi:alpha-methylacyl-CoA racemase
MVHVLKGIRVIEMAGLAPAPFAGMVLSDFGASVIRIDKPNQPPLDVMGRNKRSICVSLKEQAGVEVVKKLCSQADVLLEPYRPGVMEKFGLGPKALCDVNPKLIYARLTGFGQNGVYCNKAGHDINYLAVSGILSLLKGKDSNPFPPINLLADFAGGGLMCVMGILLALLERVQSGCGQVVDASMVRGVSYIGTFLTVAKKIGIFSNPPGYNLLDGGAPFYTTYKTSDGRYVAVGAIERQFYEELLKGLELDPSLVDEQLDSDKWPKLKELFADIFITKTRHEWTNIFSNLEACVQPVLSMEEAIDQSEADSYTYDEEHNEYVPSTRQVMVAM